MNKKIFVFDIDDVFYDMKEFMYQVMKKETGLDIHYSTWKTLNLNEVFGIDFNKVVDIFIKNNVINSGLVDSDIHHLVDYLHNDNISTLALTARGWHPEAQKITMSLFEEFNIKIKDLKVIDFFSKKADIIHSLDADVIGYVDDSARHIQETHLLCGKKVQNYFIKNNPWNHHLDHKDFNRIDTLKEISQKLSQNISKKNINTKKFKI